jgi:hypothetical protein
MTSFMAEDPEGAGKKGKIPKASGTFSAKKRMLMIRWISSESEKKKLWIR